MRGAALLVAGVTLLAVPGVAAARGCPRAVDRADFTSASTLRKLNDVQWRLGVRATATPNHRRFVDWLDRRMRGLRGFRVRSVDFRINRWDHRSTMLRLQGADLPVAGPIPYSRATGPAGVTAPLVYVPADEPITAANAAGRIVVRDRPIRAPRNERVALDDAGAAGASGLLFVMDVPRRQARGFYRPYDGVDWKVPGAYLGVDEGQRVKAAVAGGRQVEATLAVQATRKPARTRMLLATLRGRSPQKLVVESHTDGVNAVWDNGPIVMLAMARYLSGLPLACRPRTVQFAFTTGHLYQTKSSAKWLAKRLDRQYDEGRVAGVLAVEHFGARAYDPVPRTDGPGVEMRATGRHEVLAVGVTESSRLREAVARHVRDIMPAAVIPGLDPPDPKRVPEYCSFGGEGGPYNQRLIPTVGAISGPDVLFAPAFGMEAIDFPFMRRQSLAFTNLLLEMGRMSRTAIAGRVRDQRRRRAAGAPGCDEDTKHSAAPELAAVAGLGLHAVCLLSP